MENKSKFLLVEFYNPLFPNVIGMSDKEEDVRMIQTIGKEFVYELKGD